MVLSGTEMELPLRRLSALQHFFDCVILLLDMLNWVVLNRGAGTVLVSGRWMHAGYHQQRQRWSVGRRFSV